MGALQGGADCRAIALRDKKRLAVYVLDAKRVVRMWMQSPPHRTNLLNPRWCQIGLAAVRSPSAPGSYENRSVTIVTADFGTCGR
jgi:hypothetical protein